MRPLGLFVLLLPCVATLSAAGDPRAASFLSTIPLRFDAISGSRYLSRTPGCDLTLDGAGADLKWPGGQARMQLAGIQRSTRIEGELPLNFRVNYLLGSSSAAWRTDVNSFTQVRYHGVYPRVDLLFHGAGRSLEFDFVLQPEADPRTIQLRIVGTKTALSPSGDLVLGVAPHQLTWKQPQIYQMIEGRRMTVAGRFRVHGSNVDFLVGPYNRKEALILDPVLSYSSYLGGTGDEGARASGVDAAGNVYIAGVTTSMDLSTSRTAIQPAFGGLTTNGLTGDAFVAKFSPAGALSYLTYLGGNRDDAASGIAVDSAGNAYVTGFTNSTNFPVSPNAAQSTFHGYAGNLLFNLGDAFITKIGPNGNQILYSTYLGGSENEAATGIAIDSAGDAYITGTTLSVDLPVTPGAFQPHFAGYGGQPITDLGAPFFVAGDGFVAKLNPAGTQFLLVTYLGGSLDDTPACIALDPSGNIVVGGSSISNNFPVTANAFQPAYHGENPGQNPFFYYGDGFITKLNPTGTSLVYSTYLGGSGDDRVAALTTDSTGAVYATGATSSSNFPITANAYQKANGGPAFTDVAERVVGDAFLVKLDPTGSTLLYGTYVGGSGDDAGNAIALDSTGAIYIGGQTVSLNFPAITPDGFQKNMAGAGGETMNGDNWGDAFLSVFSADGTKVTYGTYLGGALDDSGDAVTLDSSGNVYLLGTTMSSDFPVTANAFQPAFGGFIPGRHIKGDAFLAKFSGLSVAPAISALANAASGVTGVVSPGMYFSLYGTGLGPTTAGYGVLDSSGKLATLNSGAQITINGVAAPLGYVSSAQINALVPFEVQGSSTAQVIASYQGQQSAPLTVNVAAAAPGLFSSDSSGHGQGAVLNSDGSYNSTSNPAATGSEVVLFGTGEGQTTPAGVDGLIATGTAPAPAFPVSVTIGGQNAQIVYKGGIPGVVAGALQLNVLIPAGLSAGAQAVLVTVGQISSQPNLTVAVRP
jgi:uncharacterized protein (TIGR03437 family)